MKNSNLTASESRALRSIVSDKEMIATLNYALARDANAYGAAYSFREPAIVEKLEDIYIRIIYKKETVYDIGAIIACLIFQFSKGHSKVGELSALHEKIQNKHRTQLYRHGLIEIKSMSDFLNLSDDSIFSQIEVNEPALAA